MTWIVTNGMEGKDQRFIHIKDGGGLYWTEDRSEALVLGTYKSAESVRVGLECFEFPKSKPIIKAVVDQLLNVG